MALCLVLFAFFLFKQKTAYGMRISDWSSDVCSSDLIVGQSWSSDMPRSGVMPRFCAGYLTAMRARILVPVVWAVKAPPVMATVIAYTMEVPIIVRVIWVGRELAIAFAHDTLFTYLPLVNWPSCSFNRSEEQTSELQSLMRK